MKRYLITGLIILLPLALTIAIIGFVVNFLTKPFMGIVSHFLAQTNIGIQGIFIFTPEQILVYGSQLIILACLFTLILFLGMIARWYLVKWFITIGEKILHRLPLINKVYRTLKDIVTNLFGQGKNTFKQVVMVPFPKKGIYILGLLSQPVPKACSEAAGVAMTSVFVPTAPNPTTGFTIMYPNHEIILLDMRPEDAIKHIVSCGMVSAEPGQERK